MGDITSKPILFVKAALFVLLGVLSAALIVIEHPSLRVVMMLAIAIWSFCRAYYFAFYVIEHYIDPSYRFAGLGSVMRYLWRAR